MHPQGKTVYASTLENLLSALKLVMISKALMAKVRGEINNISPLPEGPCGYSS